MPLPKTNPTMHLSSVIPPELSAIPQWLVWRVQLNSKGVPTKVPLVRRGNVFLESAAEAPDAWMSLSDALSLVEQHPGELDGVGLSPKGVVRGGWTLALLDCDRVVDGNVYRIPQTLHQLRDLGAYVELSPSGKGLRSALWLPSSHPIVTGTYKKINTPGGEPLGELFTGGYCTFTGNVVLKSSAVPYVAQPDALFIARPSATVAASTELAQVEWDEDWSALSPEGLSSTHQYVFAGDKHVDRSAHMLHVLAQLSWQCESVEELAARAWATPGIRQYCIDHREHRAVEHQQEFCLSECAKAWSLRDTHMPPSKAFDVAREQVKQDAYVFALQWLDAVKLEPPEWMFEKFCPVTGALMVWGEASQGKTWVSLSLAVAIATRSEWCGHKYVPKNKKKRLVVYTASEGHADAVDRLRKLSRPMLADLPVLPILFNTLDIKLGHSELARMAVEIDAYCHAYNFELAAFIVDTYIGHSDVNENAAEEVEEFFRRIRTAITGPRDALLVMTHHAGKNGVLRGSSNFAAFFDAMWRVDKPARFIEVANTKMRSYDKTLLRDFSLELSPTADGGLVLSRAVNEAPTEKPPPREFTHSIDAHRWVETERLCVELLHELKPMTAVELIHSEAYTQLALQVAQTRGVQVHQGQTVHGVLMGLVEDGVLKQYGAHLAATTGWSDELESARLDVF